MKDLAESEYVCHPFVKATVFPFIKTKPSSSLTFRRKSAFCTSRFTPWLPSLCLALALRWAARGLAAGRPALIGQHVGVPRERG